ncbi:MAG TPA: hypothetical protein VGE18_01405 [Candidatus Paceibacterota bacterium]
MEYRKGSMCKTDRIEHFIAVLNEEKHSCSNMYQAYEHLVERFQEIEQKYCPAMEGRMHFGDFENFLFVKEYSVYMWVAVSHVVFIHVHGAYGVYERNDISIFHNRNVHTYKKETPLVCVENSLGYPLW